MYSVQHMQGLDYILKVITRTRDYKHLYDKKLQLVVEVDGRLWKGDFVNLTENHNSVIQREYGENGTSDEQSYNSNDTDVLQAAWKSYVASVPTGDWATNPYTTINEYPILFKCLKKVLDDMDINKDTKTKFYPYLFNATTLDGTILLPFFDLEGKEIKFVSILEITE